MGKIKNQILPMGTQFQLYNQLFRYYIITHHTQFYSSTGVLTGVSTFFFLPRFLGLSSLGGDGVSFDFFHILDSSFNLSRTGKLNLYIDMINESRLEKCIEIPLGPTLPPVGSLL